MESFGRYLKTEREQRGISIEEVSSATKISPGQIRAMEADELAALPTITYVKGFIKAYAKQIGLSPDEAMSRFEEYLLEIEQEEGRAPEFPIDGFRREPPKAGMLFAAAGVIILTLVILITLIRACAGDDEVRRGTYPAIAVEFSSGPLPSSNFEPPVGSDINAEQLRVRPGLPVVPPDSFKVRKTAAPPAIPVVETADTSGDPSPGGGAIETR